MSFYIIVTNPSGTKGKKATTLAEIAKKYRDDQYFEASSKLFELKKGGVTEPYGLVASEAEYNVGDVAPILLEQWKREAHLARGIRATLLWRSMRTEPLNSSKQKSLSFLLEDLGMEAKDLEANFGAAADKEADRQNQIALQTARSRAALDSVKNDHGPAFRLVRETVLPVVSGVQATRAFYSAIISFENLMQLTYRSDQSTLPTMGRAQRKLNEKRAEKIADYIAKNPKSYILPALTLTISSNDPLDFQASNVSSGMGLLKIPEGSTVFVQDGQTRVAGIGKALRNQLQNAPLARNESVAVTIYADTGLRDRQQMFADINGTQSKPSATLSLYYDNRNTYNAFVLDVIDAVPGMKSKIELEDSTPSPESGRLWNIKVFSRFVQTATSVTPKSIESIDATQRQSLIDDMVRFFAHISSNLPGWKEMMSYSEPAQVAEARKVWVYPHAAFLESLGFIAQGMLANEKSGLQAMAIAAEKLKKIDPRRITWPTNFPNTIVSASGRIDASPAAKRELVNSLWAVVKA